MHYLIKTKQCDVFFLFIYYPACYTRCNIIDCIITLAPIKMNLILFFYSHLLAWKTFNKWTSEERIGKRFHYISGHEHDLSQEYFQEKCHQRWISHLLAHLGETQPGGLNMHIRNFIFHQNLACLSLSVPLSAIMYSETSSAYLDGLRIVLHNL